MNGDSSSKLCVMDNKLAAGIEPAAGSSFHYSERSYLLAPGSTADCNSYGSDRVVYRNNDRTTCNRTCPEPASKWTFAANDL